MKHVSLLAGLVLVSGALAGCGSDGAPTDASKSDFCGTYTNMFELTEDKDTTGADLREFAGDLEDTGTPKDISKDERAGFEEFVGWAKDVDKDAKAADIEDPDMSEKKEKQVDQYFEYAGKTCEDELREFMEENMDQGELESPESE